MNTPLFDISLLFLSNKAQQTLKYQCLIHVCLCQNKRTVILYACADTDKKEEWLMSMEIIMSSEFSELIELWTIKWKIKYELQQ